MTKPWNLAEPNFLAMILDLFRVDLRRRPSAERRAREKAARALADAKARKDTRALHAAREALKLATTAELRASRVLHQPSAMRSSAPTQGAA